MTTQREKGREGECSHKKRKVNSRIQASYTEPTSSPWNPLRFACDCFIAYYDYESVKDKREHVSLQVESVADVKNKTEIEISDYVMWTATQYARK